VVCRVSGFGFWVSGFGLRVLGFGFRVSGVGLRVLGVGFWVSGFGFRVSGFRFRVSGFGLRVSGFETWGSGSGILVALVYTAIASLTLPSAFSETPRLMYVPAGRIGGWFFFVGVEGCGLRPESVGCGVWSRGVPAASGVRSAATWKWSTSTSNFPVYILLYTVREVPI